MQEQIWWTPLGAAGIALFSALLATWLTRRENRRQEDLRWQRSQNEIELKMQHEVDIQWREDRHKIYTEIISILEAWYQSFQMWEGATRGDIIDTDDIVEKEKLIRHSTKFRDLLISIRLIGSQEVFSVGAKVRDALMMAHLVVEPHWDESLDFEMMMRAATRSAVKVAEATDQLIHEMREDLGVIGGTVGSNVTTVH